MATTTRKDGHRIDIRPMRMTDIPAVRDLQRRCFPGIDPWDEPRLASQLTIFPDGQLVIEFDGSVVATSSGLIVDTATWDRPHTLKQVSDDGFIRNHDAGGDAFYGIDIAVDPRFRGLRLARRIYEARKGVLRSYNLRRFLIAGRIPGYHRQAAEMTPQDYVRAVVSKRIKDPVLTTQLANGFAIRAILPDYLPSDRESRGHAVFMEWLNPDYVPVGQDARQSRARVSAVQYQMRPVGSFDEFARQCEFFVDTAADYHSDFLLFPELLTNQLQALVPAERPALTARRLDEFTGAYVELFNRLAIKYNVNIIAGTHLLVEQDRLHNVAHLFRRDGSIAKQYKIHITPAESRWWGVEPGHRLEVFDTDRGRIAIIICYDIEFPELARIATSKGADIIFVPFNTDIRSGYLRVRYCAQARSIENNVYCVLSGACGNLPQVEGADVHYAQSCILTPSDVAFARDGIGAEATPNVETMIVHDLDIDLLRRTRRTGSVRTWEDRRIDVYRVSYREGDSESVI